MSNRPTTPPKRIFRDGDKVVLQSPCMGKLKYMGNDYKPLEMAAGTVVYITQALLVEVLSPADGKKAVDPVQSMYRLTRSWKGRLDEDPYDRRSYNEGATLNVLHKYLTRTKGSSQYLSETVHQKGDVVWATQPLKLGSSGSIPKGTALIITEEGVSARVGQKAQTIQSFGAGNTMYQVAVATFKEVEFTWVSETRLHATRETFIAA